MMKPEMMNPAMTGVQKILSLLASLCGLYAVVTSFGSAVTPLIQFTALLFLLAAARLFMRRLQAAQIDLGLSFLGAVAVIPALEAGMGGTVWACIIAAWLQGWLAVEKTIARQTHRPKFGWFMAIAIPVFFGFWLLFFWEALTVGLNVPTVLLPPPSMMVLATTSRLFRPPTAGLLRMVRDLPDKTNVSAYVPWAISIMSPSTAASIAFWMWL